MNQDSVAKKDLLISGASGAIGRAIAQQLAKPSYRLHLTSRQPSKLETLIQELGAADVSSYAMDLSDPNQGQRVVEEFFKKAPMPYGMICNAGNLGPLGLFAETPYMEWLRGLTENFLTHAAMIHAFAKRFSASKRREGAIIVLGGAGIGGNNSFANMTCYSTAKAALVHLVEALAPELQPLGITINAVAPGQVLSGITEQALQAGSRAGAYAQSAQKCKASGGVPPLLTAELVEFLLGAGARTLTGRLLSARFDQKTVREKTLAISNDPNLYRLRRIDGELFFSKAR